MPLPAFLTRCARSRNPVIRQVPNSLVTVQTSAEAIRRLSHWIEVRRGSKNQGAGFRRDTDALSTALGWLRK